MVDCCLGCGEQTLLNDQRFEESCCWGRPSYRLNKTPKISLWNTECKLQGRYLAPALALWYSTVVRYWQTLTPRKRRWCSSDTSRRNFAHLRCWNWRFGQLLIYSSTTQIRTERCAGSRRWDRGGLWMLRIDMSSADMPASNIISQCFNLQIGRRTSSTQVVCMISHNPQQGIQTCPVHCGRR